jgi:hypothetical protein
VLDRIGKGEPQVTIAEDIGVSLMALNDWLHADDVTFARAQAAMLSGAEAHERRAIAILEEAQAQIRDEPQLASAIVALAKERAQAAWRQASVRDPRRYSERRTIAGDPDNPIGLRVSKQPEQLTDAELVQFIAAHQTQAIEGPPKG